MKVADITRLPISTRLVALRINAHASQDEIRDKRVRRNYVEEVTLVSHEYYQLNDYRYREATPDAFTKAPASAKGGKGFLAINSGDGTYRVIRPNRIVGTAEEMEKLWNAAEAVAHINAAGVPVVQPRAGAFPEIVPFAIPRPTTSVS